MSMTEEIFNPNRDLNIPKWLDEDYFGNILKRDEPEYGKILKFTPVAAIAPGENFASAMYRVFMTLGMKDGHLKTKSYVLKTMLDQDKGGEIVRDLDFFPKEVLMYRSYLPAFEALYRDAGVNVKLAPACVHTDFMGDKTNLVFEDLRNKKFKNVDRLHGLDLAHMRRVLHKLAELHAASAVWAARNGPYPKEFSSGFVHPEKGRAFQERIYKTRCKDYKHAMTLWGLENVNNYLQQFPTMEQFWKCCVRTLEVDEDAFNVLNHGDFWSSNIMFKYRANGDIDELLFVDFQGCKWGSPAHDLLFFITISAAKDIRTTHFDRFIEVYHEHLIDCLQLLKYEKPLPKLRDLQMSLFQENNTFHVFFAIYNHLVVVMLPTDKDSNIHTLMSDNKVGEQFRLRAYTNPLYVEAMLDLYPFFYRRGLLHFKDFDSI